MIQFVMPKIFIIYGPSGSGQDAVIEGICKQTPCNRVITTVTRKMRPGEKQGQPYYFISTKKFENLLENNAFIEWARVYGDYRGCEKKEIDRLLKMNKPIIWKVDWQGAKTAKKLYPKSIVFFIQPPSPDILKKRILKRGLDSP
jgi:guanylate kinase